MTTLEQKIKNTLPEGYILQSVENHKASTYYYIDTPKNMGIVVRTSDHDAIAQNSKAHLQFVTWMNMTHFEFDFEQRYDSDDYEIELDEVEVAKQLTDKFGIEISEDEIEEYSEFDFKLNVADWDKMENFYAAFTAFKVTEINPSIIY